MNEIEQIVKRIENAVKAKNYKTAYDLEKKLHKLLKAKIKENKVPNEILVWKADEVKNESLL